MVGNLITHVGLLDILIMKNNFRHSIVWNGHCIMLKSYYYEVWIYSSNC